MSNIINSFWFQSAPTGSYILDEISSTPKVAISLARYLKSDMEGSNVVRIRMTSNSNLEFDFTIAQLLDGTAESAANGGYGFISIIYDQSGNNNHWRQTNASRQHLLIVGGVLLKDSKGNPAMAGKVNYNLGYYLNATNVFTGTSGALFVVARPFEQDNPNNSAPNGLGHSALGDNNYINNCILGGGYTARGISYSQLKINGNNSAVTNLSSIVNQETIYNITGLNYAANTYWRGADPPRRWPHLGTGGRICEQIEFNTFDPLETSIIEINQNDFYGYY